MASGRSPGTPSGGRRPASGTRSGANRSGSRPGGGGPNRSGAGNRDRGRNPVGGARRKQPTIQHRQVPWLAIGAIGLILVLVVVIGYFLFRTNSDVTARDAALAPFRPTSENKDPSLQIPGVVNQPYAGQYHVSRDQRVRYDKSPPFGGPHDNYWAACTGTVYNQPVRSENMVHSLEHGAVWIAYDPARVTGPALQGLQAKVQGQSYMMISPYPGLDQPISLQSWGHQLKLSDPADARIDQFVAALRTNPNTHPEVGASCDALGEGYFDPASPPPFQPLPARGPNTVGMDYKGKGTPG